MADPYLGSIHIFAGDYAPRNYALCDGQLLSIQQNTALYSLIGTAFGGDAKTTFALPDMRGRIPVHRGNASGNPTNWSMGTSGGKEHASLTNEQIPVHNHLVQASSASGTSSEPGGNILAGSTNTNTYSQSIDNPVKMATQSVESTGANQEHENRMPFLAVNFIIALFGVYPMRP